jgi:hypothetical protein
MIVMNTNVRLKPEQRTISWAELQNNSELAAMVEGTRIVLQRVWCYCRYNGLFTLLPEENLKINEVADAYTAMAPSPESKIDLESIICIVVEEEERKFLRQMNGILDLYSLEGKVY